jgi:plasmid stabilization system protein ParE
LRLRWSDEAVADVERHWLFHAERNVEYADAVEARLRERAEALLQHPRIGRPVAEKPVRELSVPDIQYVIVYQPADDDILIVRIWSTAEDR